MHHSIRGHGDQTSDSVSCSRSHLGGWGTVRVSTLQMRNGLLRKPFSTARENLQPEPALNSQLLFYSSWCKIWIVWGQNPLALDQHTHHWWKLAVPRVWRSTSTCTYRALSHTNSTRPQCSSASPDGKQSGPALPGDLLHVHSRHQAWRIPNPSSQQQTVVSNIHAFFLRTQKSA